MRGCWSDEFSDDILPRLISTITDIRLDPLTEPAASTVPGRLTLDWLLFQKANISGDTDRNTVKSPQKC